MPDAGADRPLIAIAWPKPDYLKALRQAGGEPHILRPGRDPLPDAIEHCDGVLLTGGVDVDPVLYGEADRHSTVKIDAERDSYETALTKLALERSLPLFAICRGVQLLNVVAGGTLVQDIPTTLTTNLVHRRPKPPRVRKTGAHEINLAPGTRLASLLGEASTKSGHVTVNSRHHQAIKALAPGFVVSATAPDGVVEAIERPDTTFCVGVQWHPENYWRTGEFSSLFEGLVAAAIAHRAATRDAADQVST